MRLRLQKIITLNEATLNHNLDCVKKQLEKFEDAGILKSRIVGRSKLYRFNDEHPFISPLKELIKIADINVNERGN